MHKSIIIFLSLLVILLPVGTSNMNIPNVNAIADYDNEIDRKQVNVDSLKCNNINVNVNGLELDVLPPFLSGRGLAAEAAEGQTDASSFANSGANGGSQINDFSFICINNNNNTVIGVDDEEPTSTPPVVDECDEAEDIEACFEEFLPLKNFILLTDTLASPAGLTVVIDGQDITLRSFVDICEAFEGLTFDELDEALVNILFAIGIDAASTLFFRCVAEALDIPIP